MTAFEVEMKSHIEGRKEVDNWNCMLDNLLAKIDVKGGTMTKHISEYMNLKDQDSYQDHLEEIQKKGFLEGVKARKRALMLKEIKRIKKGGKYEN